MMARHQIINGVQVAFSQDEEDAQDAKEQAWADGAVVRNARQEIVRLESTVTPRRIREMTTVAGAKWVDDLEKLIAIERAKL
jgi:hypothetical protein